MIVVMLIFAGLLALNALCGLMAGRMFGRSGWIYKDGDPTLFALDIGVSISACIILTALAFIVR